MPDISEMDAYECLRHDWGQAYEITRAPGLPHPYRATRRDDRAAVLAADTPAELRALVRADFQARPVTRQAAP